MRGLKLAPFVLAALCAACTDFGGPINRGGDALSPQERRLQAAETKLTDVQRRLDAMTQAGTGGDSRRLADELRELRGQIEQLRFDVDSNLRRNQDLYGDLDRRLQRLEGTAPMADGTVAPGTPGATGVAGPPGGTPAATASPEEEKSYLAAFELLKAAKYDDAILGFQNLLANWPNGRFADAALYWSGEAYYFKRDYKGAEKAFSDLLARFPSSTKVADSLLKLGYCQLELKQTTAGKATLEKVVRDHPNSTAANLARQRLEQLRRQG